MKRSMVTILAVTVVLFAGRGVAQTPVTAETGSGLYLVTPEPGATIRSPMLRSGQGVFVRLAVADPDDSRGMQLCKAVKQIKARHHNVYALAVNTDGVVRASQAVRKSGRVLLLSPQSRSQKIHLAAKK